MKEQKNIPIVFCDSSLTYLTESLKSLTDFILELDYLERFANQELHIVLSRSVANKHCLILGAITPPDSHLFAFLALAHTLKKEKAKKVSAVLPYLAYSRQEKQEPQKSQMSALIGSLFMAAGIDEVITFDIHSLAAESLFPMPIYSLSPAGLFAEELKRISFVQATIVSPDEGALTRCQEVAKQLNSSSIAWVKKTRSEKGIAQVELQGCVGEKAVIIDDILDTGQTLVSCSEKLLEQGAKEIIIMVTHGLFTGDQWKQLWDLGVTRIYCTNTIPIAKNLLDENPITVLSINTLLVTALIK
ncbi:MAG: ribose-phosphate diphosphokinase [Chlamydiota bacterium]